MGGFIWISPERRAQMVMEIATAEDQIEYDLMTHVHKVGMDGGMRLMPGHKEPVHMIYADIPDEFVRQMRSVNLESWLAKWVHPEVLASRA